MDAKMRRTCRACLERVFGVKDYRPGQKAAAEALLSGRDLLCILPTGAGKSLCWQLPAVVHEGLTLVVTPLIALMQDQLKGLANRGIPAVGLNSMMSREEMTAAMDQVRKGSARILFVAPERLQSQEFWRLIRQCPPWLVVVDEAHCVVQWGESFRPAYAMIGGFLNNLFTRPVVCAMTATADRKMQRQILDSLAMVKPVRVILPALRENLVYHAIMVPDPEKMMLRLARDGSGPTVIFCGKRKRAEDLAAYLRRGGCSAEHYHAGLNREERSAVQQRFTEGRTHILTATTAFGMGVDIPGIRRVIHDHVPFNVTDLLQQSGRAGRDGQPAQCILMINAGMLEFRRSSMLDIRYALRDHPLERHRLMKQLWYPLQKVLRATMTRPCIPAALAGYMGQRLRRCGKCSACRQGPLVRRIPNLLRMRQRDFTRWLVDILLKGEGIPEKAIAEAVRTNRAPAYLPPEQRQRLQTALLEAHGATEYRTIPAAQWETD